MKQEHHLKISELRALLEDIEKRKGDLPCYVYSVEERRPLPMTEGSLSQDPRNILCISAILPWVETELNNQVARENENLRDTLEHQALRLGRWLADPRAPDTDDLILMATEIEEVLTPRLA